MDTQKIYAAGKVLRYHANIRLSQHRQTDADHTWGCLALLYSLMHPRVPSPALVYATVFHDAGELDVGDLPYPFKQKNPAAAEEHNRMEDEARREMGIAEFRLTDEEHTWLKLVDGLEAAMFIRLREPLYDVLEIDPDGVELNDRQIYDRSVKLGCSEKIVEIFPQFTKYQEQQAEKVA